MSEFSDPRLQTLDGFRVEIDPARERADIVLDRPPLNVIEMGQRDQLRLVFEALDEDARVRVIVLRAIGQHFSSGGNIAGFLAASPEHVSKLAWNIAAPARCSKPAIVANRGYCFGVGFEISLACDFRLVSETCFYALPEQRLGQIPGSGGSARLQKIIGITRTKDIVMRSKRIPAKQAYEWGIATECVADDKLEAATDALVEELRGFSPLAQRTAKTLLNETEDTNLEAAIELEGHCYSRLRQSDDFREGVEAFNAKRKAMFPGSWPSGPADRGGLTSSLNKTRRRRAPKGKTREEGADAQLLGSSPCDGADRRWRTDHTEHDAEPGQGRRSDPDRHVHGADRRGGPDRQAGADRTANLARRRQRQRRPVGASGRAGVL